jgi:hypothetical protein
MAEIARYDMVDSWQGASMVKQGDGEWVRYADHVRILGELDAEITDRDLEIKVLKEALAVATQQAQHG